jgi:hypothetical protein
MTFADRIKSLLKSIAGGEGEKEKPDDEEEEGFEIDGEIDEEGDDDDELEKSHLIDATDILHSLAKEMKVLNKSIAALGSRQDELGEAIVGVAELTSRIANLPMPTKSVLAKGGLGGGETGRLTKSDFEQAQRALAKSCGEKQISIQQCTRLESEMQKAMVIPGYQMKPEDRALISSVVKAL